MRSIFRRKQRDEISEDIIIKKPLPSLGIFSQATESIDIDPVRELKRLDELEEIFVRSKKLESLADVPYVVEEIKDGNIVLLDISRLNDGNDQTHIELRRIIERIRGATRGYRADIALVNDGCMIITPSFVKL